ncbi:MAG: hypothetical protein AAB414_00865 [Patescibacteria group bacterium]
MQTIEIARWSAAEAIDRLVALEGKEVNLVSVVSRFPPNHVHVKENTPANYLKNYNLTHSLEELFSNECMDWQVYFGTLIPSIGRWGGDIEHLFNLDTTRVNGIIYRAHTKVWQSDARTLKRRLIETIGPKNLPNLVMFDRSRQIVEAMLEGVV